MKELDHTDVIAAVEVAYNTLAPVVDHDWSVKAGTLEWSCRQTLDHLSSGLSFYYSSLAISATERIQRPQAVSDQLTIADLLLLLKANATILARVVESSPSSTRGFHPAGMADPSGFAAMGCDEILIHTSDIAAGLGVVFQPLADLSARVVDRLFPWAPTDYDQWQTLLWANGRTWLPNWGLLEDNWYWQCAPLSEWNGTINKRKS
jgi:hypothetical protein